MLSVRNCPRSGNQSNPHREEPREAALGTNASRLI